MIRFCNISSLNHSVVAHAILGHIVHRSDQGDDQIWPPTPLLHPPTSALHNLHPEYSNWSLIDVVHLQRFMRRILLPQSIIKYGQSRISLVPEIEFHVSEPGMEHDSSALWVWWFIALIKCNVNARERSDLIKPVAHKHRLSCSYSPKWGKLGSPI